ncbi:hypothetical protein CCACVL1_12915 [Corchorus capsularis]|uniref:Uncharacterized protein n=1 Tax=Corchorus capsularis TaxID=210143 RepID=A0A1R3ID98_COCAP|nr:hypothetical protein CCACVL1_12915 [Corchorus capsularis]
MASLTLWKERPLVLGLPRPMANGDNKVALAQRIFDELKKGHGQGPRTPICNYLI